MLMAVDDGYECTGQVPQSRFSAGRHRVSWLMNIMELQAIHCLTVHVYMLKRVQGPNTSKASVPHRPAAQTPPLTAVELRLQGGPCLHFDSTLGPVALTSMIRAVEAA